MQKAKEYDWKDSNMALFGSDVEKKVKKESALAEPAWEEAGAGTGLQIFRVVKFKIEKWDPEQYGEFYNGDSYIILNTYKDEDKEELKHDVHFWIGKYSTQDEYGTAAYKTVELDIFLDDKPVQHREVQGHESQLFKSYFDSIKMLKGGADTGFRRVLPEAYKVRLLHVQKQDSRQVICNEVSAKKGNLKTEDVFIIDKGLKVYQWNGRECSHDEKYKAASVISKLKESRSGCDCEVLEEASTSPQHPAVMVLRDGESKEKEAKAEGEKKMFKISDEDGSLDMDEVEFAKANLNDNDVFIVNTGEHVFCYVGKGASIDERRNAMTYACNYVNKTATPWLPISVVAQGYENQAFHYSFLM